MTTNNFWYEFLFSSVGPCLGAIVGGIISLIIAMLTLKKEGEKDIGELLLTLRENRKKMKKIFSEINELHNRKNVTNTELCLYIENVACNKENQLGEVESVWQQKRSLVYTGYGDDNYSCLQELINQFNFLIKLQSEQIKREKVNQAKKDREICDEMVNTQSESSEKKEHSAVKSDEQFEPKKGDEVPKALVNPKVDINCQDFFELYNETEKMFEKIPSKYISDRLRIK